MSVGAIEGLIVAAASVSLGVVLLRVSPDRLPEPLRRWSSRLGRYRRAVGGACVVVGLLNAALAISGRW